MVFGKKDTEVRRKIKNRKLIARTKSVWDFCRNDIMHYSSMGSLGFLSLLKKRDEIIEIIVLLFKDFYGKSDPDDEIERGFTRYCISRKTIKFTGRAKSKKKKK